MNLMDKMPIEVKTKLRRKTFAKNETILFAENENNYVYFLIEGTAEAYILNSQGVFSNIHIYEPGSFFGEIEQFYEGRKPVQISAVTPCAANMLHKDDFLNWMKKDFEITKLIIKELAYKLILNGEYIEELSRLTVKERLLRCIAIHYHRGDIGELTKEMIAKETKAPIRSVNRAIAEYAEQGVLYYQNKQIIVLQEEKINMPLRQS